MAEKGNEQLERYHDLDALRAGAMLLGVWLHVAIAYIPNIEQLWPVEDRGAHWFWGLTVLGVHGFRLQLFFVMAGFFAAMTWERRGPRAFCRHRLRRIGVPLVLGCVVLLPLMAGVTLWGLHLRGLDWGTFSQQAPEFTEPNLGHLWFLWYLLWLLAGFAGIMKLAERWNLRAPGARWVVGGWRFVLVMVLTLPWQWLMGDWTIDPPLGLLPIPRLLGYYAVFFAFGCWLWRNRAGLAQVGRHWPWLLAAGPICLLVGLACTASGLPPGMDPETVRYPNYLVSTRAPWLHWGACVAHVLVAWCFIFSFMGLARRIGRWQNARVRYVADASYWLYLSHLPVVLALQFIMADWPGPGALKLAANLGLTLASLLAVYAWVVRRSWLGKVLHGPRRENRPE